MALVLNDRVKETSTTTGTGTLDLDGAVTGFEGFVAGIANTNTTYYCIAHTTADEWEVGLGTVTDAGTDTLSRDTVISSSNSDSKVVFTAGTKDVFCTEPASKTMEMLMTGSGDIIYSSAANTPARLAKGSDTEVLTLAAGVPSWAAPTVGDITGVTAGTGLSGGGTSGTVTLNLANTAVSAGSYTVSSITVDAQGRLTAASSGTPGVTAGFSIAMSIAL
tara:strand:+ start:325 stop:984 length:660 start_codon:yes stop_codon:yes gene_type:complete